VIYLFANTNSKGNHLKGIVRQTWRLIGWYLTFMNDNRKSMQIFQTVWIERGNPYKLLTRFTDHIRSLIKQ
tara:strand:+ start:234 stop:446 length:213 start_codon:yes stop_codon:yes gene_type:complete